MTTAGHAELATCPNVFRFADWLHGYSETNETMQCGLGAKATMSGVSSLYSSLLAEGVPAVLAIVVKRHGQHEMVYRSVGLLNGPVKYHALVRHLSPVYTEGRVGSSPKVAPLQARARGKHMGHAIRPVKPCGRCTRASPLVDGPEDPREWPLEEGRYVHVGHRHASAARTIARCLILAFGAS